MTVRITDERAREIAGILERLDEDLQAEYNTGSPDARSAADELRKKASPEMDPIQQWGKKRLEEMDTPGDQQ